MTEVKPIISQGGGLAQLDPEVDTMTLAGLTLGASFISYKRTVSEAVAQWDPVCISDAVDDNVRKAVTSSELRADAIGVALAATPAAGTVTVAGEGAVLVGALVGATRGELVYIATAGGLTTLAPVAAGEWVAPVGRAISATDMLIKFGVKIQNP